MEVILALLLNLIATVPVCYSQNFTVHPQSQNATNGSLVSFYCMRNGTSTYLWYINGTLLSGLPRSQLTTVSTGNLFTSEGSRLFYLRLVAQPVFNNSRIQCQANSIFSNVAILKVQGQLHQVGGLTAKATTNTSIFVSWMPPFSLEITPTNTETGTIFYCVDIYNTIISHLVSVCGLAGTQFVYFPVDPSPCDSVNVVVTPVNAAGNGSRSHSTGVFYNAPRFFTISNINLQIGRISNEDLIVQVTNISQLDITCSCSICLTPSMSTTSNQESCHVALCNYLNLSFHTNGIIERRKIVTFKVVLQNAGGSSMSDRRNLSTYDLQKITVTPLMLSGTIDVHLQYIQNASTSGCFLIFTQGAYTGYFAVKKTIDRDSQSVQLEGLPEGEYTVRGYEAGEGGVFHNPLVAALSDSVMVNHGTAFWKQVITSPGISALLNEEGSDLCITCKFSARSTSLGCVVLLHPRNIFSDITIEEIGLNTTQPFCIPIEEGTKYFVAVFEWRSDGFVSLNPASILEISTLSDEVSPPVALVLGLTSTLLIIVGCLAVALSIIVILKYRKWKEDKGHYSEPETDAVIYAAPTLSEPISAEADIAVVSNQADAAPPNPSEPSSGEADIAVISNQGCAAPNPSEPSSGEADIAVISNQGCAAPNPSEPSRGEVDIAMISNQAYAAASPNPNEPSSGEADIAVISNQAYAASPNPNEPSSGEANIAVISNQAYSAPNPSEPSSGEADIAVISNLGCAAPNPSDPNRGDADIAMISNQAYAAPSNPPKTSSSIQDSRTEMPVYECID